MLLSALRITCVEAVAEGVVGQDPDTGTSRYSYLEAIARSRKLDLDALALQWKDKVMAINEEMDDIGTIRHRIGFCVVYTHVIA